MGNSTDKWKRYVNVESRVDKAEKAALGMNKPKPKAKARPKAAAGGSGVKGVKVDPKHAANRKAAIAAQQAADRAAIAAMQKKKRK